VLVCVYGLMLCMCTSSSSMLTSLLRSVSRVGASFLCAFAHASTVMSDMARMVSAKGLAEYLERRHRCTVSRSERSSMVMALCFMRAAVAVFVFVPLPPSGALASLRGG
jgi:hypothetical protein